jgi:phage-related protein (TIGR01555 family)
MKPGFTDTNSSGGAGSAPFPRRGQWLDTLRNFAAGLMTRADKMSYGRYGFRGTIGEPELENMYRANWLARKICDAPAEDMTRQWITLETEDGDAREELEAAEKEFSVIERVTDNLRWSRLYGGSAIYPSIRGHNPATPLRVEEIRAGTLQGFMVLDRCQINPVRTWLTNEIDLSKPDYWRPEFYNVRGTSTRIHQSRLLFSDGATLPLNVLRRQNYWCDSVLQSVYDEMQRGDSTAEGTASMFFEACVDVLKIAELRLQLGSEEGTETLIKRFEVAALMKSFNHMLLLDAEDDYSQKTNSFTGIPEVMRQFMDRLAGACDIPATRLFGISPSGMNATGSSDMRNYYDMLKAKQEQRLRPVLEYLYDIMSMSVLGELIDDLVIEFNPLQQQDPKELAQTELFRAQRDQIYCGALGVASEAQVADRLRANDTYIYTEDDMAYLADLAEQAKEEPEATVPPAGAQPGAPGGNLNPNGNPGGSPNPPSPNLPQPTGVEAATSV